MPLRTGETLLRENSHGSAYFVLLDGLVVASSSRRRIDVALTPGVGFGETALVPSLRVRREASVTALDDTWCLRFDGKEVNSVRKFDVLSLQQVHRARSSEPLLALPCHGRHRREAPVPEGS